MTVSVGNGVSIGNLVTSTVDPVTGGIRTSVAGSETGRKYLGLVASRGQCPSDKGNANKQCMARSKHVAMANIASLQLVYANWMAYQSGGETTPGAASQYTASIEYPVGTLTRVTFSGATTGIVADGDTLVSDAVAIDIPKGTAFYVRSWQFSPGSLGIMFMQNAGLNNVVGSVPASGEWFAFGTTTADLTGVTTNANNALSPGHFKPTAIIGLTDSPTIMLIGDSRLEGGMVRDTIPNAFGGIGQLDRSLGGRFATLSVGRGGEKASDVVGSGSDKRVALSKYVSAVVSNYGINDCHNGAAAATTIANLATLAGRINKPFYQCTVSPESTSTDNWSTVVNQTPNAVGNPLRVALNGLIRNGLPAPFSGYIEIADPTESSRDSGAWKVPGASFTSSAISASVTIPVASPVGILAVGQTLFGTGITGTPMIIGLNYSAGSVSSVVVNVAQTLTGTPAITTAHTTDGIHGGMSGNQLIEFSPAFANFLPA